MKCFEVNDNVTISSIIIIIIVAIIIIAMHGCSEHEKTIRYYVEHGYTQQQKIGAVGSVWSSPDTRKKKTKQKSPTE